MVQGPRTLLASPLLGQEGRVLQVLLVGST